MERSSTMPDGARIRLAVSQVIRELSRKKPPRHAAATDLARTKSQLTHTSPVRPLVDHALTIRAGGPRVGSTNVGGGEQRAAAETAVNREDRRHRFPIPHERVFERLLS